jgi:hypothetical protein
VSTARWNLKEGAGKALARRTEIAYEACVADKKANIFKVRYLYGSYGRKCGGLVFSLHSFLQSGILIKIFNDTLNSLQ